MMRLSSIGNSHHTQQSQSSMQPAHDRLTPAQMHAAGPFQHQVREVSTRTLQHLNVAAKTQQEVRALLKGSGNQWLTLVSDQGESAMRGIMAVRATERYENQVRGAFEQRFQQPGARLDRAYAHAHVALTVEGGHCQEFSDLTYTHLAAKGVNTPVMNALYDNDHVLVLLGDMRHEHPVVLDTWQYLPVVTTLDNSVLDPSRLHVFQQRNDLRPDPEAQWALQHVETMSLDQIEAILTSTTYPSIGKRFVKHMVESQRGREPTRYDVRSLAQDPSTRYTDHPGGTGEAFDRMQPSSLSRARRDIEEYERAAAKDPGGYGNAKRL